MGEARAKAVSGVRDVLQVDSGIAVIADDFWHARQGRDLLEIEWDEGAHARLSTAGILEDYAALSRK